jgi:hypothetical protein
MNSGLISACFNLAGNTLDNISLLHIWFNGYLLYHVHVPYVLEFLHFLLLLLNQLYNPGWVSACSTIFFQASGQMILDFLIKHSQKYCFSVKDFELVTVKLANIKLVLIY